MKQNLLFLFLIAFTLKSLPLKAQETRRSLSAAPVLGAHLLPQNGRLLNDRITGLDLAYGFSLSEKEDAWVRLLNAREFGLRLIYRDLNRLDGHQDTSVNSLGKAYGLAAQLEIGLLETGPLRFSLLPSAGLSYISKSFFTHPRNRFIGSHLNHVLMAALQTEFQLNPHLSLLANVHVLHLSNGGFNIPNSGINSGNLSLGMKSYFGQRPLRREKDDFTSLGRHHVELVAGIGRRGKYESHQGMAKSAFYAGYNYRINPVLDLKGGLDAVYYFTVFDPELHAETYQHYATSYEHWRLGLSLGAELKMSRFAMTGRYGRYLHYRSYHGIDYYWNSGLRYMLSPRVGLQSTLHMHRFQADFVDFGLALKL